MLEFIEDTGVESEATPFVNEDDFIGGLVGKSEGSEEFDLLIFPLPNPNAPFDFVFVRVFVAVGEGGFPLEPRRGDVGTDCWSVMEAAGVSSAELASGSGRGGGGDTLLRG
jgi:hypothetical protein